MEGQNMKDKLYTILGFAILVAVVVVVIGMPLLFDKWSIEMILNSNLPEWLKIMLLRK